jgi:branched-subunit amino acid ABC-type transport system permease component
MPANDQQLSIRHVAYLSLILAATAPTTWFCIRALSRLVGLHFYPRVAIGIAIIVTGIVYAGCRNFVIRKLIEKDTLAKVPDAILASEAHRESARICISRGSSYADKYRAYTVMLDGRAAGRLDPEGSCTLNVPAGTHRVSIKIDWTGSNTLVVDLLPQTTQMLRVTSNLRGARIFLGLWYILFSPQSYLHLDQCQSNRHDHLTA